MKRFNLWLIFLWVAIGIYGVFYNITYIDEAKYLIKGWLIASGQVGYYSTPEFFYQHMPGIFLWYGWPQTWFGPSLFLARLQSFLTGLGVLWLTYKIGGKKILSLLILAPVAILYYSAAVPQSIVAFGLMLGFYWLFKGRYRLATLALTLCFVIRENFLFTLVIYWLWLLTEFKQNKKELLVNYSISLIALAVFFVPGWPGTINVLKNFPGISRLLPVTASEKEVLGLNWFTDNFSPLEYWRAIQEFGGLFPSFLLAGLLAVYSAWKKHRVWPSDGRWRLLIVITSVNFSAHAWSAFHLSPRAIIPYLAYSFPLLVLIFNYWLGNKTIKYYYLLLIMAFTVIPFASLFQSPDRTNTISQLNSEVRSIKPLIVNKSQILWLANPMPLYLAGRVSYSPLINQSNFFKPSTDTITVQRLGFWNQNMFNQWLKESDLIVIDYQRLPPLDLSTLPKNQSITWPAESALDE